MKRRDQRGGRRIPSGFKSMRDVFTAGLGAAGILHETVFAATERPTLLIIFAGLLGLPLVLREGDRPVDKPDTAPKQDADSDHGTG